MSKTEEGLPIVGNDYDEIPMDVKLVSDLKIQIAEAQQLANAANKAGIDLVKTLSLATQIGDLVRQKEAEVNGKLENAAAISGVKKEDFLGFDLERGTIRVKKPVLN